MGEKLRRGCLLTAVAVVVLITACSSGGGTAKQESPAPPAGNNGVNNPGNVQQSEAPLEFIVEQYESCHTQHLAGGASDGLYKFRVNRPDGTKVIVTFRTSLGKNITGTGTVKSNDVVMRVALDQIGETLDAVDLKIDEPGAAEVDTADDRLNGVVNETVAPDSFCDLEAEVDAANAN
jgi:hypothetical protein